MSETLATSADDPQPLSLSTRETADRLSLVHVSDEQPGIRRRRAGRGFFYVDAKGRKLRENGVMERIRGLAVPPAWTDVWICPDPKGHIQAVGRDQKGRKQYRYHERWVACRDEVKFGSLADFARALPMLREAVDQDLRRRSLTYERVVAAVVWLLDNTMIRVGNVSYARDNASFGLTTLRDRHVNVEGANLRFAFTGKSGKEWQLKLSDRRIARVVKGAQDIPGQHLFQYFADDGGRRAIRSEDVNAYIRETTGSPFTSKHFRTWGGTVHASVTLASVPVPDTESEQRRVLNESIDQVASFLGNTRTVCRNCYVHPGVIEDWRNGDLAELLWKAKRSFRKPLPRLSEPEMTVLGWLRQRDSRP